MKRIRKKNIDENDPISKQNKIQLGHFTPKSTES